MVVAVAVAAVLVMQPAAQPHYRAVGAGGSDVSLLLLWGHARRMLCVLLSSATASTLPRSAVSLLLRPPPCPPCAAAPAAPRSSAACTCWVAAPPTASLTRWKFSTLRSMLGCRVRAALTFVGSRQAACGSHPVWLQRRLPAEWRPCSMACCRQQKEACPWPTMPSFAGPKLRNRRFSTAAGVVDGCVYVTGGYDGSYLKVQAPAVSFVRQHFWQ